MSSSQQFEVTVPEPAHAPRSPGSGDDPASSSPPLPPSRVDRAKGAFERMRGNMRPPSSWTLRTKLVASMLVLFTLLSVATSIFTITALNRHLVSQIDEQLAASITTERPPGGTEPGEEGVGPGTARLEAQYYDDGREGGYLESRGKRLVLTPAQLGRIEGAVTGHEPQTIFINGAGRFRVLAADVTFIDPRSRAPIAEGTRIIGLSTVPTDATISRMIFIAMAGVLAGVILVGGIGTWIVRRNLEPLRRVADTATRVSRMPLHTGQVALPERVAAEDTDTRTEVGQVGAAFNEMLDHVDEALNARHRSEQRVRQFVADASHELRTPLASIKGYAELSKRESNPVPNSVTHAMGRIESEAGRMGSLVEDLLLLARLDAGRPLDAESVDVSMLVVNAVSDAHAAAPSHEWNLDLPPEPVEVRGDPARLHQIVTNLLANARTHTPAGTRVTTSVRPEGEWVRIAVHDNGPGVPTDLQPNVFERFARGDSARSRAGGSTGLGLSIVAAVTRAHGGSVEMSSKPGDTTFALRLPSA